MVVVNSESFGTKTINRSQTVWKRATRTVFECARERTCVYKQIVGSKTCKVCVYPVLETDTSHRVFLFTHNRPRGWISKISRLFRLFWTIRTASEWRIRCRRNGWKIFNSTNKDTAEPVVLQLLGSGVLYMRETLCGFPTASSLLILCIIQEVANLLGATFNFHFWQLILSRNYPNTFWLK